MRKGLLKVLAFAIFVMVLTHPVLGQVTSKIDATQFVNADGSSTVVTSREILVADKHYYLRTDGSDNNSGLANDSAHAFATLQKAFDTVGTLDLNGHNVYINIADRTYSLGTSSFLAPVG